MDSTRETSFATEGFSATLRTRIGGILLAPASTRRDAARGGSKYGHPSCALRRGWRVRGREYRVHIAPNHGGASNGALGRVARGLAPGRRRRRSASLPRHPRARTEDPRSRATAPEVSSDNPLQATEGFGLGEYFQDLGGAGYYRARPGAPASRGRVLQRARRPAALLNLLLVWSLENPRLGYRQGMRARVVGVFAEGEGRSVARHRRPSLGTLPGRAVDGSTADDEAGLTSAPELSASYVEHDAYAMFAALMERGS